MLQYYTCSSKIHGAISTKRIWNPYELPLQCVGTASFFFFFLIFWVIAFICRVKKRWFIHKNHLSWTKCMLENTWEDWTAEKKADTHPTNWKLYPAAHACAQVTYTLKTGSEFEALSSWCTLSCQHMISELPSTPTRTPYTRTHLPVPLTYIHTHPYPSHMYTPTHTPHTCTHPLNSVQ